MSQRSRAGERALCRGLLEQHLHPGQGRRSVPKCARPQYRRVSDLSGVRDRSLTLSSLTPLLTLDLTLTSSSKACMALQETPMQSQSTSAITKSMLRGLTPVSASAATALSTSPHGWPRALTREPLSQTRTCSQHLKSLPWAWPFSRLPMGRRLHRQWSSCSHKSPSVHHQCEAACVLVAQCNEWCGKRAPAY